MRAILSVRPKCSHRCLSRKETPLKPAQILTHATRISTEQTSMRTKCSKHIAIYQARKIRDADMTIKTMFERSSQKGGRQGVRKEGQQGTHLEILLSA